MSENIIENQVELIHESPLYAEHLFNIGNFSVTNSLLSSFLALVLVVFFGLVLRRRIKEVPGKLQSAVEMLIEALLDLFDTVTHSRKKTLLFAPLIISFFVFILLNNWLGLLPGVGSVGKVIVEDGHHVFIPFLRGATADLNTTLSLAIIGVFISHILGVVFVGWWHHFNKFINLKALMEIPKKIWRDPAIVLINPIKLFVGLIEIIGELAKVASLSFRLFGNIFAGEVLLVAMSAIMAFAVPIPFMFLELMVGAIQAFIFSILILTYLSINTTLENH